MPTPELKSCPFCGVNPRDGMNGRTCYHPKNDCTLDGWHFNVPNWQSRPTTVVTDEVVERVARALFEHAERRTIAASPELSADPSMWLTWDSANEPTREPYREAARAAIEAMPTVVTGEQQLQSADRDEVVYFLVKIPAQRGWIRWKKDTYRTFEEARTNAEIAVASHGKARIVERRSLIRETIIETLAVHDA